MKSDRVLTIDLANSNDANVFHESRLIHQEARQQFGQILKRHLEAIPKDNGEDTDFYYRSHSAIGIFGRRGDGKSSFLLHLIKSKKLVEQDVMPLNILDPTLIEDKENALITIISMIKTRVEAEKKAIDQKGEDYRKWVDSIKDLARGIRLLDNVTTSPPYGVDQWEDEQYLLKQGLIDAKSGQHLEQNFNKFLKVSLELIGKKAFLLAFDDVDTKFERGWAIVETMRKYLTSPRLIVLISGDLKLYSVLVQKKQWEMFGDFPGKESSENYKKYRDMVGELEEQYLLKLLQVRNRIHLKSIYHYVQLGFRVEIKNDNMNYVVNGDEQQCSIHQFLNQFFYVKQKDLAQLYLRAIFSEPTRTVIQMFNQHDMDNRFWDLLPEMFFSLLDNSGFKVNELKASGRMYAFDQLVSDLLKNSRTDFYKFYPHAGAEDSMVKLIVGAIKSYDISMRKSEIFSYWIKACLFYRIPANPVIADMKKFEIGENSRLSKICNNMFEHKERSRADFPGAIGIFTRSSNIDDPADSLYYKVKSATDFSDMFPYVEVDSAFMLDSMRLVSDLKKGSYFVRYLFVRAGSSSYFSFYHYLATLGDFLTKSEDIVGWLDKFIRDKIDIEEAYKPNFMLIFKKWLIAEGFKLPMNIYYNIFEKMHDHLYKIESAMGDPGSNNFLGFRIHRLIVVFLNTVLFEEARSCDLELNSDNPLKTDHKFLENLDKYQKQQLSLPFFDWLWTCPFWGFYLMPAEKKKSVFVQYVDNLRFKNEGVEDGMWRFKFEEQSQSLFYLLNRIPVKSLYYSENRKKTQIKPDLLPVNEVTKWRARSPLSIKNRMKRVPEIVQYIQSHQAKDFSDSKHFNKIFEMLKPYYNFSILRRITKNDMLMTAIVRLKEEV